MADFPKKYWWLVLIAVPIIVALISVLPNLMKHEEATAATPAPVIPAADLKPPPDSPAPPAPSPEEILSKRRQTAEKLATKWMDAMLHQDAETLVKMADPPFYFDSKILVGLPDIRSELEKLFNAKRGQSVELDIKSIQVKTVAEMRAEGYDEKRDRVLKNLHLDDVDFAIAVLFARGNSTEGLLIFTRDVGPEMKIAGTWD